MAFPTSANQVQAFAGALYGVQIGSVTMAQVTSDIAAVGGLNNALNNYFHASFGSQPTATVAATFAANLGLTGAALTEGTNYVTARLNGVAANARGAVIADILNLFAGLSADATYGAAATAWNTKVAAAAAYTGSANLAIGSVTTQNQIFTLSTDVDAFTGGAGNDTVKGVYGTGGSLSILDTIDGQAGTDTLDLVDASTSTASTMPSLLNVVGIEKLLVRGAGDINVAASAVAFTTVTTTQSAASTVAANAGSDVAVSGATGAIVVNGGKDITVTDSTVDGSITIGGTTVSKGAVSVTDTKVGNASIAVDGGTDVTINVAGVADAITTTNSTTIAATTDVISVGIGGAATDLPSGAVVINQAHTGTAGTDVTLNTVQVKGGTSVVITNTADSSKAAADTTGATVTQGAITVTGGATTTAVTVNQVAVATENVAVAAVAAKAATTKVTFTGLAANEYITLTGDTAKSITFTAAKALTALEVAAAFANLVSAATTGSAPVTNGVYTNGTSGTLAAGFTTGAVTSESATTASVTFSTATDADSGTAGIQAQAITGTSSGSDARVSVATSVAGNVATLAETGVLGVTAGKAVVDGDITGTDVLTTVTLNAYGDASTVKSGVLTTLNLTNADEDLTVTTASTGSVTLNLNKVAGTNAAVSLDGGSSATVTGVTINATGTKSDLAVTAAAATTVTINASVDVDLTDSSLVAATTMVVTGAGKVILDGDHSTSVLAAVDASAATGTVDASGIALTAAGVYTGGAGADTFTVTASATKASTGGAGDDVITVSSFGSGGSVNAGDGTDTLVMAATDAATASASAAAGTAFMAAATNFEKLSLGQFSANNATATTADEVTVDLSKLTFNYVISAGTTTGGDDTAQDKLLLTNAASGVTLEIAANGLFNVGVKDASTGTADVVNVVTNIDGNLTAGTVTTANVETVNITADDKVVDTSGAYDEFGSAIADGKDDTNSAQSISLTADKAATVNVAGSADVTLDLVFSSVVTAVNASTMTGKFELVADGKSTGTTVTGGAGADTLTAYGSNDVLIGGAGNDKLTATSLTTLTGGAGNDTFVLPTAVAATEYSTISDLSAGDVIDTAATTFATSKITLAANSTFAQYLDTAVNAATATASVTNAQWFQFNGDTFLVIDGYGSGSDAAGYTAAQDSVIAFTGLVTLSNAVFNATTGDLTIA